MAILPKDIIVIKLTYLIMPINDKGIDYFPFRCDFLTPL